MKDRKERNVLRVLLLLLARPVLQARLVRLALISLTKPGGPVMCKAHPYVFFVYIDLSSIYIF